MSTQSDEEMPDAPANGNVLGEDDLRINGEPADLIKIRIVCDVLLLGATGIYAL